MKYPEREKRQAAAPDKAAPKTVFDIVEVKLPAEPGKGLRLFAAPYDGPHVTNLFKGHQMPGMFIVERVRVDPSYWSGDDMEEAFWLLAKLRLQIGGETVIDAPVSEYRCGRKVDLRIDAQANVVGWISFDQAPWTRPELVEWAERQTVDDSELVWPEWLRRRFGALLPRARHSRTSWATCRRPREGSLIVKVCLDGQMAEPVAPG